MSPSLRGAGGDAAISSHRPCPGPMACSAPLAMTTGGEGLFRRSARSAFAGEGLGLVGRFAARRRAVRSEEHTSELQSLMRISYAVFCLKNKKNKSDIHKDIDTTNSLTSEKEN